MGLNHLVILFLLGFVYFSLGKEFPQNLDVNDPMILNYLTRKLGQLKNVTPQGTTSQEQMELIRLITAQQKAIPAEDTVLDLKGNKELEELKSFLALQITKIQHSEYLMTVMEYLKATVQVVEGMLLKATVQVGQTNCYLYSNGDANDCEKKIQAHQVCDVKVWLKPWMKYREVIEVECQPLKPSFCAGCPIEKDPNSPFIKQYLEKTLYKLNEESEPGQKLTLVKIDKATSQVVNGVRITIYFHADKPNRNYTCKTIIALIPSSQEHVVEEFTCTPFAINYL